MARSSLVLAVTTRSASPTRSSSRARASTTCASTTSSCPSTAWSCSPGRRARASRRSRSTRCTPRASAATSSRCRRTRGSSSARWRSRSTSSIRGLSPTIAIEQKSASSNPRSTVGTITEIYDYLRVLYARAGEQRCHLCGGPVGARTAARDRRRARRRCPTRPQVTLLAPQGREPQGRVPRAVRRGCARPASCACASTA